MRRAGKPDRARLIESDKRRGESSELLPSTNAERKRSEPLQEGRGRRSGSSECAVSCVDYSSVQTCLPSPRRRSAREDVTAGRPTLDCGEERVRFLVGNKEIMVPASKPRLAAASEVFNAMFYGSMRESRDVIAVPDLTPEAVRILVMQADGNDDLRITEDIVVDVLTAADKYQVRPVLSQCFHFLIHKHSRRGQFGHVWWVLTILHRLNQAQTDHHDQCLVVVKRHALHVLQDQKKRQELCVDCLRSLNMADYHVQLTQANVWSVQKAASDCRVSPVLKECFDFLIHQHTKRHDFKHSWAVLSELHRMDYGMGTGMTCHNQCLELLKTYAKRILQSAKKVKELCRHCLLELVKMDDIGGVKETDVHKAVVTWAKARCLEAGGTSAPTWEDMRTTAGDLVHHVRYLTMPEDTLTRLLEGRLSGCCLLTREEMDNLLDHNASLFPRTVRRHRVVPSSTLPMSCCC